VKNLVLPAAEEAESIWTDKFGFSKMNPDEVCILHLSTFDVVAMLKFLAFFSVQHFCGLALTRLLWQIT